MSDPNEEASQARKDDNVSVVTLDPDLLDADVCISPVVVMVNDEQDQPPDTPAPSPPPLPPPIIKCPTTTPTPTILGEPDEKSIAKMYDSPRYHTTTTVVETTEYMTNDGPNVSVQLPRLDCAYIRTLGGIMKCVCILLCLLTFIFVMMGPAYYTGVGWSTFVSSIGIFVTTSLLTLYLFRVVDSIPQFNWIVAEMVFCFAWTVFFFIAACVLAVAASQFHGTFAWAIAAFFAFGAMCAYGFDCYLKFLSWKNNEKATGGANQVVIEQQRRNYI